MNRVKRSSYAVKKPRPQGSNLFRDRGGSNRILDRPRPRTTLLESKNLNLSAGDSTGSIDHLLAGDEPTDVLAVIRSC